MNWTGKYIIMTYWLTFGVFINVKFKDVQTLQSQTYTGISSLITILLVDLCLSVCQVPMCHRSQENDSLTLLLGNRSSLFYSLIVHLIHVYVCRGRVLF